MHRIAASMLWAAASVAAAQGLYSPSVVHGTSSRPAIARPALPLQPAAPPSGVTSIAPSAVLGWGGLPPPAGMQPGLSVPARPAPGYPVLVVPVPVPVPVYPSPYGSTYPSPYSTPYSSAYPPDPSTVPLHRWSAP